MMPQHGMRNINRLQLGYLLLRELDPDRSHSILQVMRLGRAHDWGRDFRLVQQPCQRDLGCRHSTIFGDLGHGIHNPVVGFLRIELLGVIVFLYAQCFGLAAPGQHAARQRALWDKTYAFGVVQGNHLALFLAIDQVVVVLHGHKARQPEPV